MACSDIGTKSKQCIRCLKINRKTIETEPSWQSPQTTISWFATLWHKSDKTNNNCVRFVTFAVRQNLKKKWEREKPNDEHLPPTKAWQMRAGWFHGCFCVGVNVTLHYRVDYGVVDSYSQQTRRRQQRRTGRPQASSTSGAMYALSSFPSLFRIFYLARKRTSARNERQHFYRQQTRRGRQTLSTTVAHQQASLTRPHLNLSYACWHKSERRSKQFDSTSKPMVWKAINMTKVHLLSR